MAITLPCGLRRRSPVSVRQPATIRTVRAHPHTSKLRSAVVKSVDGRSVTILPATSAASRYRYRHRHYELVDAPSPATPAAPPPAAEQS